MLCLFSIISDKSANELPKVVGYNLDSLRGTVQRLWRKSLMFHQSSCLSCIACKPACRRAWKVPRLDVKYTKGVGTRVVVVEVIVHKVWSVFSTIFVLDCITVTESYSLGKRYLSQEHDAVGVLVLKVERKCGWSFLHRKALACFLSGLWY